MFLLWPDRHLEATVTTRAEDLIRFDDLVEIERVREQRRRIETLRLHQLDQPAHAFLPAGAKRGNDFLIAKAGCKRFKWNCSLPEYTPRLLNVPPAPNHTQRIFKRSLRAQCLNCDVHSLAFGQALDFGDDVDFVGSRRYPRPFV